MTEPKQNNQANAAAPTPTKKKRPLWRRILWTLTHISLGVLALILLILILLWGLLFTNPGLNSILWAAEKFVPELKVESTEGALLTDFELHGIAYDNPDLTAALTADKLELDIQLRCLAEMKVCIKTLGVEGANFSLAQLPVSEDVAEEPSEPLTSISLPFGLGIDIERLYFNDISLDVLGNKAAWRTFESGAKMRFDNLILSPTIFDGGRVTLAPSKAEPPSSTPPPTTKASDAPTDINIVLPEIWIPLSATVQDITVTDFKITEPAVEITRAHLVGEAHGNNVTIQQFELVMPQLDLNLDATAELKGDYPLSLDLDAKIKQTTLAGQSLFLNAKGSAADLSLNAGLRDLVVADLDANLALLDPNIPFDIDLTKTKVQWPLRGEADYKAQIARLQAKGSLTQYALDLQAAAQGKQIPDVNLAVDGEGNLEQIDLKNINVQTLKGVIKGQVLANWAAPINWDAKLNLQHIQPGSYWPNAEGDISGDIETTGRLPTKGGWEVELSHLDIDGIFRNYPLNINGVLQAKDISGKGDFRVNTPGIVVAHGQNNIRVSGNLDQNWNIDTRLDIPEIKNTVPDASGKAIGLIQVRGPFATPEIIADVTATKIAWLDQLTVASVSLKGDVTPLPAPQGDLDVVVAGLQHLEQKVKRSEFSFSGSEENHRASFSIDSDVLQGGFSVQGSLDTKQGIQWKGELQDASLTTVQGEWVVDHSPKLAYDGNTQSVFVEAHCWLQADSKLCLDKDVNAGQSGEVFASIQSFNFSQVAALMPQDISVVGTVDATVRTKWSPSALPELEMKVDLPQGSVTQQLDRPLVVGWNRIDVTASLLKDDLKADWDIDLTDNGAVKGRVELDKVSKQDKQIDAQLQLQKITLDMLAPMFGEFSKVAADINSDIKLKGPVTKPQVFGDFRVENIIATGDISPVDITGGQVVATFSGYQGKLDSTIVTQDGDLLMKGDGDWQNIDDWRANLSLSANQLLVEVPPMVKAKVEPDIDVAISPGLIDVKGEVRLPWGRITVEELPPSAISVSSDEVIVNKDLQPLEESSKFPFEIKTNIKVVIGDDFLLSAFGLKGGLVGEMNVSQKNNAPFILGEVNIVDGKYRSFGQDLLIQEGKVQFNGPADLPYLSIKAIRNPDNTEDDVIAGIKVTGPADEPSIEVFSEPSMPQANALSYILRGQDLDSESGGNAMTTALIGLSLARSGRVVGEIGEAFGVSDLQLDTAGSGDDSQVTVSGYILPGLQVKYGVGIFESIGEFTFRYRLMKDLYLELVSGTDSAVDLLYQFEFD
ncbi:translocation/assembly module TamB domain-containing protein [Vibrio sp. B1Z05]|uniref:autotransporter assembly complex protein TamB n=1 Tax=Vibrio sp. B1Z05 TaxID=2654980 RepID=UPI00128C5207|nr:translocation/assembly module TamB domain-containing protein [Vibrio sp. B1Z05]MPW36989.1 translocation/assembly module TamB [Vibrio sp. B1Z05]